MDGRPVWDPDDLELPDDLARSFTLGDDDEALAGFLQAFGYLHVRDVFAAAEVESLRAEVQALADGSRPDDTTTWWTRTADGENVVCQVKYGALRSTALADLHDDPRVRRILAAAGEAGLAANLDRNEGTKVIYKRPGATEGMTDLPFHTDCGMGYHPIACPMVLIGVHLDRGTPASGQLHMVPGSHRSSTPDPAIVGTDGWPIAALTTEPGDCTVHFGHTLHAAPPPVGELGAGGHGRRTFYLAFAPPTLFDALAPMEDLVGAMQQADGITKTVDDVLARPY
jgi:ectoine hydroxylase-related dioxygenase (phytanoyl-CoA dioxygenase family)